MCLFLDIIWNIVKSIVLFVRFSIFFFFCSVQLCIQSRVGRARRKKQGVGSTKHQVFNETPWFLNRLRCNFEKQELVS